MDYFYEFLVSFFATTIGVVFALILERWYSKVKEGEEAVSITAKILIELKDIRITMLNIHSNKNTLLLDPIKMPIYQGFVNSSKISLLDRYTWYNNLLNLYKYLDTYNAWHNARTERLIVLTASYDNDELFSKINKSLEELEKIVLGNSFNAPLEELKCDLCSNECVSANIRGLISCMILNLETIKA